MGDRTESSTEADLTSKSEEHGQGAGVRGMVHDVWMGNEPVDWKRRRMEEERRADEEGLSIGDRILAQIWTVWNQVNDSEDRDGNEGEMGDREGGRATRK